MFQKIRLTRTNNGEYLKQPDDHIPIGSLAKQQHGRIIIII